MEARRTGLTTSTVLRTIVLDYLLNSRPEGGQSYPLRDQARRARQSLHDQGIKARVTGTRGRWRIERIEGTQ